MRLWKVAAAIAAALGLLVGATPAPQRPHSQPTAAHPRAIGITTAASTVKPISISGLGLHDGQVVQVGRTLYQYGTEYGCGFQWALRGTHFCGFGVSKARSLAGPWTAPVLLFSPQATVASNSWAGDNGRTWDAVCAGPSALGCFNAEMVKTPTGTWELWFNSIADNLTYHVPAYWVMGCAGPAGPCGAAAGYWDHKPALTSCNAAGDFSILTQGTQAAILCAPYPHLPTLTEEALTSNWTDGTAQTSFIGQMPGAEGEGAYQLPDGSWEMVYSEPGCGYCTGPPALKTMAGPAEVQAGYATAPTMMGPWTVQGFLSPSYCTGQPRRPFVVNGVAYEWLDRWIGTRNEAAASVTFEPMAATPWMCS